MQRTEYSRWRLDYCDRLQDVLVPPGLLRQEFPLTDPAKATIQAARNASMDIISGEDDRVLVIVGPCSIHDAEQGLAVCDQLKKIRRSKY